ncbi:MAG TPA: Nramp family divalent metal transporter [Candidatus Anammoximicrobium sp.]|nr:Nramp family divalent metal transporter [Candidatus Anammoximicrobium sp.]
MAEIAANEVGGDCSAATDHQPSAAVAVQAPPRSPLGILRQIGPGLIVAGSIVGSGELIGTTKTGAEAGFWLLWLILIGCVIKVFVQVEFGRYSLVSGRTTMSGLAEVPGPRIRGRGNWLVWYWFVMWLAAVGQLGGVAGGVGQALAISWPITHEGRTVNQFVDCQTQLQVCRAELRAVQLRAAAGDGAAAAQTARLIREIARLETSLRQQTDAWTAAVGAERFQQLGGKPPPACDEYLWAAIMGIGTSVLLVVGRYRLVQLVATAMVCGFTLVTLANLGFLQANPSWRVTAAEFVQGFSFRLPPDSPTALATALATFGIIGVGATELLFYPYWCLEKGYARFSGPRDQTTEWAVRAKGWMRVMRCDAWCSMVLYTFATLAFYLLGAAVLGRTRLNPAGKEMIRTLAVMYEPVFSEWASALFLAGAFAVLYSTYFVSCAGHSIVLSDALGVVGLAADNEPARNRRIKIFSGLLPLVCVLLYVLFPHPTKLVLLSGAMQAIMLPMLASAALYFRYRRNDPRLTPSRLWDIFLWLSAVGMLVAGLGVLVSQLF